jgi:dolichyl-phosphate beta-glucosyltransferase
VSKVVLVVPAYNEANRLDPEAFLGMLSRSDLALLFVNDGSKDATADVLERVLSLPENRGKGEAVRAGMLSAVAGGAEIVGYFDADLATPPAELFRLLEVIEETGALVVLGSRVRLLGRDIQRRSTRHYLGRLFATAASTALGLPLYDTQCGAKLFRHTPALERALARPFRSRWAFDVELISRLRDAGDGSLRENEIEEVPLRAWRDVRGSKLSSTQMIGAAFDLAWIGGERIAQSVKSRRARR